MNISKPAICIYGNQPDAACLKEICAGIEEEGVLYQFFEKSQNLDELAYEAANESMLGVGIGICKKDIALSVRLVEKGKNVFSYKNASFTEARIAGMNSARAVKKTPFKYC